MQSQSFTKDHRLCSQKIIDQLFKEGRRFLLYPFMVVWQPVESKTTFPLQVLVSVSKKKFKKAVHRNLIKRRIREAYRKNIADFFDAVKHDGNQLALGIVYTGSEIMTYAEMEEKILLVLQRLRKEYEKTVR